MVACLPSFTEFLSRYTRPNLDLTKFRFVLTLFGRVDELDLGFYRVLPSFTEFYRVFERR